MYVCISPAGYLLTVSFFSGYFAPPFSLPIQEPLASMHTLVGYFTYIYVRSLPLYLLLYVQYVRGPSSPSSHHEGGRRKEEEGETSVLMPWVGCVVRSRARAHISAGGGGGGGTFLSQPEKSLRGLH